MGNEAVVEGLKWSRGLCLEGLIITEGKYKWEEPRNDSISSGKERPKERERERRGNSTHWY